MGRADRMARQSTAWRADSLSTVVVRAVRPGRVSRHRTPWTRGAPWTCTTWSRRESRSGVTRRKVETAWKEVESCRMGQSVGTERDRPRVLGCKKGKVLGRPVGSAELARWAGRSRVDCDRCWIWHAGVMGGTSPGVMHRAGRLWMCWNSTSRRHRRSCLDAVASRSWNDCLH